MDARHDTVLLSEAVEALALESDSVVVDATVGAAGHFGVIVRALGSSGVLIGIDADAASLTRAEQVVAGLGSDAPTVHLVRGNFRELGRMLGELSVVTIDAALFDLGWNGFQLAEGRGFSFRSDEPLLMTYGEPEIGTTAADLVNGLPESELADLIYEYGEERFARSIARSIVDARRTKHIVSTLELAEAVERGTPGWYQHRRIHPATKTFQALRIATNDELGALREGFAAALAHLAEGGRIAVITFHSIEDRIVKGAMKDAAYAGKGSVISRKPIVAAPAELLVNPRARSAKLRVFERCASTSDCAPSSREHLHQYA